MVEEMEEADVFNSTEINLNESINYSGKIRSTIQKFDIALQADQGQLERTLSVAVSVVKGYHISAGSLWEKTDALMTDAASKYLKTEQMITTSLESDHEPVYLLCKSHTVEKLDASYLNILSQVEYSVNQRQTLENITPFLKSFFRGKKTTVENRIDALITLVSYDKSGKSCSQGDLTLYVNKKV